MEKATNDNSSDIDGSSANMDQSRYLQSSEERRASAMQVENRSKDVSVNSQGNIDSEHASDANTVDGALTADGAKNVDGAKTVYGDEKTVELESMPTKHSSKRRRGRPRK